MKIIAIADTHGLHHNVEIPEGDVLIVAGDICSWGRLSEIEEFSVWLSTQPCRYRIVIAGNHDETFQANRATAEKALVQGSDDIIYLQDSSVTIEDVTFYGSPWTPTFFDWHFMADRGEEIRRKWSMIPDNTDVLITHGPPAEILDKVRGVPQGCTDLLEKISQIEPEYHIFGHIHEEYGVVTKEHTTLINASVCDERYRPINKPVIFEILK